MKHIEKNQMKQKHWEYNAEKEETKKQSKNLRKLKQNKRYAWSEM